MANVRLTFRQRTAAQWPSASPVLAASEIGYDTTNKVAKMGDGALSFANLPTVGIATVTARPGDKAAGFSAGALAWSTASALMLYSDGIMWMPMHPGVNWWRNSIEVAHSTPAIRADSRVVSTGLSSRGVDDTSLMRQSNRVGLDTTAVAGSIVEITRPDVARVGVPGKARFGFGQRQTSAAMRFFYGYQWSGGALANLPMTAYGSAFFVGADASAGHVNLGIYPSNDTTQPRTDLGASFPAFVTNAVYDVELYIFAAGDMAARVRRLDVPAVASFTFSAGGPPSGGLGFHAMITNNSNASIVQMDFMGATFDSAR